MRRVTAHGASLMGQQDPLLPFEVDACLWRGSGGTGAAGA
jgi:thymidine kinase